MMGLVERGTGGDVLPRGRMAGAVCVVAATEGPTQGMSGGKEIEEGGVGLRRDVGGVKNGCHGSNGSLGEAGGQRPRRERGRWGRRKNKFIVRMGAVEGSNARGISNMEKEHVPLCPKGSEGGYVEEMVGGCEEDAVFRAVRDSGDVGVAEPGVKARSGQGRDENKSADRGIRKSGCDSPTNCLGNGLAVEWGTSERAAGPRG